MTFAGEIREVASVPEAFADLVAERRPSSIALSGGSTAEQSYRALATRGMDWSGTDVFLGDERFVPVTDPDSNEGMIREALFATARPRALHSMAEAGTTVEEAAPAYDALLRSSDPIDIVHLGLGPDGHTASLVPGDPVLDVTDRAVAVTAPYQGRRRMTPAARMSQPASASVLKAEKRPEAVMHDSLT